MTTTHSLPLAAFVLERAEATLNRWIAQSSAAQQRLRTLEGHSMRVDVVNTGYRVRLSVVNQHLCLGSAAADSQADIVLAAGLFELSELLRAGAPQQLRAGEIEFRGSLRIAEEFARLMQLAMPTPEDELAGWIGGVPARAAALTGQALLERIMRARRTLELDTAEFLQSEAHELPLRHEIAEFLLATERLRDDVDRLAQRIDRLAAPRRR